MKKFRISIAALTAAALVTSSGIASAAANFSITAQLPTNAPAVSLLPYDEIIPAENGFLVKQDSLYGLLDDSGECILKPEWASICPGEDAILVIDQNGKYGYTDWTGAQIVPPSYDFAAPFADGFAKVQKDGKFSYIDKTGKLLIPWQAHEIQTADGQYFTYRENSKSTVLDHQGNVVLPPFYENMLLFRDGVAAAMQADGWYGLIDTSGAEILPFQYRELRYIGKGLYLALKDNKQGYVNAKGQPVGPMIWEPSAFPPLIGSLLTVAGDGKAGIMDLRGNLVQELRYHALLPSPDGSGPIIVRRDTKYGLVDATSGKLLLEPILELDENGITPYENGFATVQKNGYEGILDAKGNLVVRPEYQKAQVIGDFLYLRADDGTASIAQWNRVLQPLNPDILTVPTTDGKVQSIVEAGILQGDDTGNLLLDATVTRAQFVTMLSRIAQWDLSANPAELYQPLTTLLTEWAFDGAITLPSDTQPTDTIFTDVPPAHWAYAAISRAAALGLVNGMGDGTFQPDAPVTTQQIFTVLVRLAGKEAQAQTIIADGGNGYADTAWELGIGTTEIGWALPSPATRELTACFLYDYLQWENAQYAEDN